jgi:hypothetical protein
METDLDSAHGEDFEQEVAEIAENYLCLLCLLL